MTTMNKDLLDRLMFAVWMVGNMDTAEDKVSWWKDHGKLWQEVSEHAELPRITAEQNEIIQRKQK